MRKTMAVRGLPRILLLSLLGASLLLFVYRLSSKAKHTQSPGSADQIYSRSLHKDGESDAAVKTYRASAENKNSGAPEVPPVVPEESVIPIKTSAEQLHSKFGSQELVDQRTLHDSNEENNQPLLSRVGEKSILKSGNIEQRPNEVAPQKKTQEEPEYMNEEHKDRDGDPARESEEAAQRIFRSEEMLMKAKVAAQKKQVLITTQKNYSHMHYPDFPYPMHNAKCPPLPRKEREFSAVVYFTSRIESYLTQTVLSLLDFSSKYNTKLKEIVLTYNTNGILNPQTDGTVEYIEKAINGRCGFIVTEGLGEWKAKEEGIEAATSDTVFVVNDMYIIMETAVEALIDLLNQDRRVIIYPHIDSMLPVRIYFSEKNGNLYPDNLIWQENYDNIYSLDDDFRFERYERRGIRKPKVSQTEYSAAFTGEIFIGHKDHMLKLIYLMQTELPAELSILAWLCGAGIKVTKCAAAVKSNNYEMEVPTSDVESRTRLSKIYRRRQTDAIQQPALLENLRHHNCLDSWTGYFRDARDNVTKNAENKLALRTTQ